MKTEFEVKILDINVEKIISKLNVLGAKKMGERIQRRFVYDLKPKKENCWVRLRTNGDKTTLTIKEIKNDNIDGTKEIEVEVDDFDKTNLLLNKLGYIARAYQENKRISYVLDGVEIEIDFWPAKPPYLEIEAKSKEKVKAMIKKLGFDLYQSTSINTLEGYKKYGIELHDIKELKFKRHEKNKLCSYK